MIIMRGSMEPGILSGPT